MVNILELVTPAEATLVARQVPEPIENPLTSVAHGAGRCVEEFEALQKVLVTETRRW